MAAAGKMETPGSETPGADTPGAETPGAETPGAETLLSIVLDGPAGSAVSSG